MKNLMVVLAFVAAFASSASAQENAEAENNAAPPQMQRLFYTAEQRLTLEVLRRDSAAAALEENTEVIPVVLEEVPFDGGEEEKLSRGEEPLEINALVRRHSDGKTFLWIGNQRFDLEKDGEFLDKTRHLVLDPAQVSTDGIIGIDKISPVFAGGASIIGNICHCIAKETTPSRGCRAGFY